MTAPGLFFWQNMPTHHQAASLDALAELWPAPVTGVWCSRISEARRRLGWSEPATRHLAHRYLPADRPAWKKEVREVIDAHAEDIHVFSGIGAYAPVTHALGLLSARPAPKMGLIVEMPVMLGWRRHLRHLKARYHYRRHYGRMGCVLTMGAAAREYYAQLGFERRRLFPFFYQTEAPAPAPRAAPAVLSLAYVGQINHRKGLDVLLEALARVADAGWTLTVYGDGPDRARAEKFAVSAGLAGRVRFLGSVPSEEVLRRLPSHDLCIVPSRFDGWGMVVNEAIQSGVPVLVSDRAGSSELLAASHAGAVFPAGDPRRLAELIDARLRDRSLLDSERRAAAAFAPRLAPGEAARYLRDVLRHVFLGEGDRPAPGWLPPSAAR
ncbi:MAG: glycosyltransferase [Opitutales bacterium]